MNPQAELLFNTFFARRDIIAARLREYNTDGLEVYRPRPVEGGENIMDLLRFHVGGLATDIRTRVKYTVKKKDESITHVVTIGGDRIGSYCLNLDNKVCWLCIDMDGGLHATGIQNVDKVAWDIVGLCEVDDIPCYIERSGGGHGIHIWVFFEELVDAEIARNLGYYLCPDEVTLISGEIVETRRGRGCEIFPKQLKLRGKKIGNMVWLPFWHGAKPGGNQFLTTDGDPYSPLEFRKLSTARAVELSRLGAKDGRGADKRRIVPPDQENRRMTVRSDADAMADALGAILNGPDTSYSDYLTIGMAIHDELPGDDGLKLYQKWCAGYPDNNPDENVAKWESFEPGGGISVATIFKRALDAGWKLQDVDITEFLDVAHDGSVLTTSHKTARLFRRAEITISTDLYDIIADSWRAHFTHEGGNSNATFYRRNNQIVRIHRPDIGVPYIEVVSDQVVFSHLTRLATWVRGKKDKATAMQPREIAKDWGAHPHVDLLELSEVSSVPLFTEKGKLVNASGYNPGTKIYLDMAQPIEIPLNPTDTEMAIAVQTIYELLTDFPFASNSDRAHAICAILLPFLRRMITGPTPIHLIVAPTPGTGKTLLAEVLSMPFYCHPASITTLGPSEEEIRKKITSLLVRGTKIVIIDNLRGGLHSAQFSALITADTWTDRLLGATVMIELPNKTTWIVTGNNPGLSMEIARRSIRISLDAHEEKPWERANFIHNPLKPWVVANHRRLLGAAITLCQAWIAADQPKAPQGTVLGSFEAWSRVMGGVLHHAQIPGFMENQAELYESADPRTAEWGEFITAWAEELEVGAKTSRDLAVFAAERGLLTESIGETKTDLGRTIRVAKLLRQNRGQVHASYELTSTRDRHQKADHWIITKQEKM